jgi:hypothetical protein
VASDLTSNDRIIRPGSKADRRSRREPQTDALPGRAEGHWEYHGDYVTALAALIGWAYDDGIEIAGWISEGLRQANADVGGMDALLARRPGSWEASYVARLGFDPDIDDDAILG